MKIDRTKKGKSNYKQNMLSILAAVILILVTFTILVSSFPTANLTQLVAWSLLFSLFIHLGSLLIAHIAKGKLFLILSGAKYLGDPNAMVYSYGQTDGWFAGRVDESTENIFSGETHATDWKTWTNLSINHSIDNPVRAQLIPAYDDVVTRFAESVIEKEDYSIFAGLLGTNSNTIAQAIANAAANMEIPIPDTDRESRGAQDYDSIQFDLP